MKLFVASDLHTEFHPYPYALPKADIALLAGDILVIEYLSKARQVENVKPLFDRMASAYDKVYYVPGNHEFYHSVIGSAVDELKEWVNSHYDNFHVLDNEVAYLPSGHKLIGSTLWTSFDNNSPISKMDAQNWMADYRCIRKDKKTRINPDFIFEKYLWNVQFIVDELKGSDHNIIVTHHSPSYQSVHDRWKGDTGNGMFHSNLEHLFSEKVPLWVHGHIHDRMDYKVNGTRVVANPRGYPGENLMYDPNLVVEL